MLIFDLESNALVNYTKIHVLVVYDYDTKQSNTYVGTDVRKGIEQLQAADCICGHNIINFDIPCIKKFYPWFQPKKVLDTLVWSRVVYPDIRDIDLLNYQKWQMPKSEIGRHSLESWGYRLREYKGGVDSFEYWTPEMSEYCEQDVRVTVKLYEKLLSKNLPNECLELEHEVAQIIQRQVEYGFLFDIKKAEQLYVRLLKRREELTQQLQEVFKPWEVVDRVLVPKRDNRTKGYIAGVPVEIKKIVTFNPSSRQHIAYQLQKLYKWKPSEYTPSGQPIVDEDVLNKLPYPEAKLLAEYFMIEKRIGQLAEGDKAWLKMVSNDGRIHGEVITCGTPTRRATHNNPNVSQVPKVKLPYGKDCRELWTVPEGYSLVDADASQLELRGLAHYLAAWDDGYYASQVCEGDIHTVNQKAAGLETRDQAKTFIYALIYGAGDEKIGSIIGKGQTEGKQLKDSFKKTLPAYKKLLEAIKTTLRDKGYLTTVDGQQFKIRSEHSALNFLIQGLGAIIVKRAMVIIHQDLKAVGLKEGIDYKQVAWIHDAFDFEVKTEYAEMVGRMITDAFRKAGEYYKLRCPMTGAYHVGTDWSQVH